MIEHSQGSPWDCVLCLRGFLVIVIVLMVAFFLTTVLR